MEATNMNPAQTAPLGEYNQSSGTDDKSRDWREKNNKSFRTEFGSIICI